MEMDRVSASSVDSLQYTHAESWRKSQMDGKVNDNATKTVQKVHVNPNFRNGKSLVIHINPRMHRNQKIHVNPKIMKEVAMKANFGDEKITDNVRLCAKEMPVCTEPVQRSIHVNPKLMQKLSSMARKNIESKSTISTEIDREESVASKKIPNESNKTLSKPLTPRLLAISRRKLVRIGSNNKSTCCVKRKSLPNTPVRKSTAGLSKFAANKNKFKLNAYKIDRTIAHQDKRKLIRIPDARARNVDKGLVTIAGVMYQSSRTQLVRRDTGSSANKKTNCLANAKDNTFVMARNGKKLHRLQTSKEGTKLTRYMISRKNSDRNSVVKKVPISIVHSSHKNVISYKAKQRSMQILRDKLRKNYIPCLIFRRFGYCANHAKGTCPKLHDKKQVAPCRNFLQGKCLLDDCPMSHDIGPEKMPTCKYFLEGCCIRDACPYLHVKVSANTPICPQFLRGYCAEGTKCKQRHANICPEFEKTRKCAKGKYCPYPHKLKSSAARVSKSFEKVMPTRPSSESIPNHRSSRITGQREQDIRTRYYDSACPSDKQLAEMRQSILKQVKCMKASHGLLESVIESNAGSSNADVNFDVTTDGYESDCVEDERPRRPPIGPLPAYIPIN